MIFFSKIYHIMGLSCIRAISGMDGMGMEISVRVAKCQIFYTDQFFPNEFTPRKSTYIVTNCRPKMHEMGKEGKF